MSTVENEGRAARWLDEQEITRVVYQYCRASDRCD
jgi:hypothetical protein